MNATLPNPFSPHDESATLDVHLLGCVDYAAALALQRYLVYDISGRNDRSGSLLICEHPPLVTIGRDGSRGDVIADENELIARQLDVRYVNRGGGAVVHSPGQLAISLVIPLDRLRLGLADYRDRLEFAVQETARELRVPAVRDSLHPGVFCRCGQFAFVGGAVKSWVAYHGLFVNVNPPLDIARLVSTDSGLPVTSLSMQRQGPVSMSKVRESLIRNLVGELGYEHAQVQTGHPWLKRTLRRVHVSA